MATEQGVRAAFHHAQTVWEAQVALFDAYKVDTHDVDAPSLPAWSELTEAQQHRWFHAVAASQRVLVPQALSFVDGVL